jgi:ribosomal protein S18 acetylase RimI-like enzyme
LVKTEANIPSFQSMTNIRAANTSDINAICLLGEEVNALHHANAPELFAAPGDALRHQAHWLGTIGQPDAATFVAEVEGAVVAFFTVSVVTESHSFFQPVRFARIGTVGVAAAHRGQGIGRALMQQAQAWAQDQAASELRLTVAAFNEAAMNLYEVLGFEVRMHQLFKAI